MSLAADSGLDPEISAALVAAGLRWQSWRCLSSIRSPEIDRVAYRVDLVGPSNVPTIKARRLESEDAACRQAELRRELPRAFVAIVFHHGRVLLEEWIDGEVLGSAPAVERLREAGAILAGLHGRMALGSDGLHTLRSTAVHRLTALKALRQLRRARLLEPGQATALARAMRTLDPCQARHGLVHFDFCGENMVVDREGRLRVVDNERIGVDALGFDLARAWYRFGLPPEGWDCFHEAYTAALPARDEPEALGFWRRVALARAVALRVRVASERVSGPLACLRKLAEEQVS